MTQSVDYQASNDPFAQVGLNYEGTMGIMVSHSIVERLRHTLNNVSAYYITGLTAEVENVFGFGKGIAN